MLLPNYTMLSCISLYLWFFMMSQLSESRDYKSISAFNRKCFYQQCCRRGFDNTNWRHSGAQKKKLNTLFKTFHNFQPNIFIFYGLNSKTLDSWGFTVSIFVF